MGIIANIFSRKAATVNSPKTLPMIDSVSSATGYFMRDENSGGLDEYKGWTFACVRSISEKVGGIEMQLKKRTGDKTETITDHPILTLMHDVNPFMTFVDIIVSTQSYLELEGNAFWWIARAKDGTPLSVWPLRPDFVTVIPDQTMFVKEYVYKIGNQKFIIPADQIIPFKEFNPKDAFRGLGTAYAAGSAINADNYARIWQSSFFKNGARIDGYLMKEGDMTDPEHRELTQKWNDKFRGVDKAHKTPILSGGLKYQQISSNAKDMDFVNLRTMSRDEILAMFRVPKTVLGVTDGTQTRATAETSEYVFMKETIRPKMQKFVRTLNEYFLPMFGLDTNVYHISFHDPVPENKELELLTYQNALTNGWMSINEVRAREGLPPIENGDDVRVSGMYAPLGAPIAPSKSIVDAKPVAKSTLESIAQDITAIFAPAIKQVVDMEAFEQRGAVMHKAQLGRADGNVKKLGKIMTSFFNDEKSRALAAFDSRYKKNGKNKAVADDLLDPDEEAKLLMDQVKKFFDVLIQAEGTAALVDAGLQGAFDARNERVQAALERKLQQFTGEVSDETATQIRKAIADGLTAGDAIPEIRKRVEEVSAFSKARSEVIARTETTRAQNFASIEAWRDSGLVESKIWYTAEDERVDDVCAALHGEEFKLDENVDPGNDYGVIDGPPIHPNCRCTLIPVVNQKAAHEDTRDIAEDIRELRAIDTERLELSKITKELETMDADQKETELIDAINELDAIERQLVSTEE